MKIGSVCIDSQKRARRGFLSEWFRIFLPKKRVVAGTRALVVASVLLSACGQTDVAYSTRAADIGDVRDVVPAVGAVQALTRVEVRTDTPGRVTSVLVEPNTRVAKGQPLARIQPDRLALDVEQARAELEANEAAVVEVRARAEQSERHLSNRRLLAEKGFISSAALSQAASDAAAATAAVRRAEADAASAAVRVRAASGALDDVTIRAPFNGFVLARDVEAGQVVRPEAEEPLFVIVSDTTRVLVEAMVAEPDIGRINRDVRVVFTVEAFPDRAFDGRVREILRAPQEERNFVSYPVLIEAENPDDVLFPGMTASVEFIHADARQVLRAPVEALYFAPDGYLPRLGEKDMRLLERQGLADEASVLAAYEVGKLFALGKRRLFVLKRGEPVAREVRVGAESSEFVEIIEGLEEGELIITGPAATVGPDQSGP